ncbi:MAG TPA: DNA-processing protein DprA [Ferruginibacter sp.]|nr:DNA-processing protein DprA [Ferruginibacter sp.]HRE64271.1 DNA-processing protein DprA [Ferruginibacter sp.]
MNNDLPYQIALTKVPNIGDVHAKALINTFGEAKAVFDAPKKQLESLEGIGSVRANSIKKFDDFAACDKEIVFVEKHKIAPLFITDKNYPQRLVNCYDSPILLYYRGTANLNADKIISIVGTRKHSEYGKMLCEKLIEDLNDKNILVVSGLAYGIDTIAHKASLKNGLQTVGVLAHGLDTIYPAQNKSLAAQMTAFGGLLTDFPKETNPDKQNFPKRNRIVAGICDALIVIESGIKGGSLITAELGNSYNKDVFAFPGKTTDNKSEGCNYLIKNNKAILITNADDLLSGMNWNLEKKKKAGTQKQLFIELTAQEKTIYDILQQNNHNHIDELFAKSALSSSSMAAALLSLEMQGIVTRMPGKIYKLC